MNNFPNPFYSYTIIEFSCADDRFVDVSVYNIKGEKVKTIFSSPVQTGKINQQSWSGLDKSGKKVSSGIYFYKIKAGEYQTIKKMLFFE